MMQIHSSTKFCHFTSVENARNILNSACFYLSKYKSMNDLAEARLHEKDKDRVFILCFSNTEALNIPEFYLYGGIDGKGCRLQFTDAKIRELLNNCTVSFVNKSYRKLKKVVPSSAYTIYWDWIYYISSNGFCEHRNDQPRKYQSVEEALVLLEAEKKNYFVKSPIWKYENEFRIAIIFNEDVPYDNISLKFNIKEKERGISICFGPETSEEEYKNLSNEFSEYGIVNTKKAIENAICMNLISRNKRLFH